MHKMKMIRTLFSAFLLLMSYFGWGQTTLNIGDIAIIGMSTGDETFAFVTFVDLDAGTEIYFTDEEGDGDFTIGTGEGTVLYTAPLGGVTAGTVITGSTAPSGDFSSTADGNPALGNSGDGLIAYQGGSVGNVTTFLHAIGENSGLVGTFPGGTLGSSDILLMGNDDGSYAGVTSGTSAVLYAAVNNVANWTLSGSASLDVPGSFTVSAVASITENTTSFNGSFGSVNVGSSSASSSFSVEGSDLTADITITAPTGFEVSLNDIDWFSSRTLTQTGGLVSPTTVYGRFTPVSSGAASDNIILSSTGATDVNIAVSGSGTNPNDADSEVLSPLSQVGSKTITAANITTLGNATDVFAFEIEDQGTADGLNTIVNQVRVVPGANNTADWTDFIQGVRLWNGSAFVTIGSAAISDTEIIIPISSGDLVITDGNSVVLTLYVYLNTSNIIDGEVLDFSIPATGHGFVADASGSGFNPTFTLGAIDGNNITVDVDYTALAFVQQPTNTEVNVVMNPAVTVEAIDVNGNRDTDYDLDINITSTGTLTGSPVTATAVSGLATFSTLTHTATGTGLELTASDGLVSDVTSATFDIIVPVTVIDFDDDANWTAGSTSIISYASDHIYVDANWTFTGGPALRNTTSAQDGFPGALGSYAWRLENNASVVWTATYTASLASNQRFISFGFDVRRWDGSPSPDFLVEYSFNGGSTWFTANDIGSSGVINNTSLSNSSDWSTFTQTIIGPAGGSANQMIVRVSAQGTTERLMIDNFTYSTSTSELNFSFDGSWSPTDPSGISGSSESISITSGTAALTADTECDELSIALGATLNLEPNVELETVGNFTNNGSTVLNADNTGYAQLKVNGAVSGAGTATVEQYAATVGWYNMAMPVSGNLDQFGTVNSQVHPNARNIYAWDETNEQWNDIVGNNDGSNVANTAGQGYLVYVGANGVVPSASTIDLTGQMYTSSVINITRNNGIGSNQGWNLIANPFTCALDFSTLTRGNVNNSFAVYDKGAGRYFSYSQSNPDIVSPIVAPMQSFWVRANAANPTINSMTMAANGTVGSTPTFYKNHSVIADRFFLHVFEATDPLKQDEFLLAMIPGTQDANDQEWDAFKRLNDAQVPSLMSVANGDELAINAIDYSPNSLRTKKLQLRFVSGKNNEIYFIELHDSLLTNHYHIELEDLKLRRKHDLSVRPYKFVHDATAEYRFVLHISPVTTINQGPTPIGTGIGYGINNGTLVLKLEAQAQEAQGALLDLSGKRVMEVRFPAGAEQLELNVNGLAKGIYLLQLRTAQGEEVHKIILP